MPTRRRRLVVPAQLPADTAAFTGRTQHLAGLDKLLPSANEPPAAAVIISAIDGTAGIGKTALAVHWAHQIRDHFPDGQLYLNLRGFDPSGQAMEQATAVRHFLDALDVPPQRIPADPDAQAALYRSLLIDKRMLIVLDNALDSAQVRPLLPGTPGCLVVITSRNQLTGLVADPGAHPITLDLLNPQEAADLLAHRLGTDRVTADRDAVDAIITRCARLPLALALVAAHGDPAALDAARATPGVRALSAVGSPPVVVIRSTGPDRQDATVADLRHFAETTRRARRRRFARRGQDSERGVAFSASGRLQVPLECPLVAGDALNHLGHHIVADVGHSNANADRRAAPDTRRSLRPTTGRRTAQPRRVAAIQQPGHCLWRVAKPVSPQASDE